MKLNSDDGFPVKKMVELYKIIKYMAANNTCKFFR